MNKKFYVTTAIPYVNAAPHIGHSLEFLQADVIARAHRLRGEEVWYLTGTDDNALKNVEAAETHGETVENYVKKNSDIFRSVLKTLNISNDDFIRTIEERHIKGSQLFWQKCEKDIYKKSYKGLYCVGCETFYLEKDLVDGKCPEHKTTPELVEEENYFFKLSKYQDWLLDLISTDRLKITPKFRKNEVLAFIKGGLEDFSISRSIKRAKGWGIPVPGDSNQIIYVWFDALLNYITALGWQDNSELYQSCWPAQVQVIGKGISRFHAIYWPAMLKSAELEPAKELFIHGYVTVNKEKISKTLGNVIDPFTEVKKYGVDPVRYYLLREIPAVNDGDYSDSRFIELYNSELANNLGNLVSRVSKLATSLEVKEEVIVEDSEYTKLIDNYAFDTALKWIWEKFVDKTNVAINEVAPWKLESTDPKRIEFLTESIKNLRRAAYYLTPFLPDTANKIKVALNGKIEPLKEVLFPRLAEIKSSEIETPKIVTGEVKVIEKLADETIQKITVSIGEKELKIICGDLSLKVGEIVPVALPGVKIRGVKIKKGKVHGVESEAMLCSAYELEKGEDDKKIFRVEGKVGQQV